MQAPDETVRLQAAPAPGRPGRRRCSRCRARDRCERGDHDEEAEQVEPPVSGARRAARERHVLGQAVTDGVGERHGFPAFLSMGRAFEGVRPTAQVFPGETPTPSRRSPYGPRRWSPAPKRRTMRPVRADISAVKRRPRMADTAVTEGSRRWQPGSKRVWGGKLHRGFESRPLRWSTCARARWLDCPFPCARSSAG